MTLRERLTQMATFFRETECRGGRHLTAAAEMMEALERITELEAALRPFATYAQARQRMPVSGLGDSLHTIHGGTEWEGEVRFSHCLEALRVLEGEAEVER